MTGAERMLAAARREPSDRTPIWFMRQAGRCLAGYRALRETYDILTITRTPELCAQVTVMPVKEFGVDAAVMYADIMLPLIGMGVPFSIDPGVGPLIHAPVARQATSPRSGSSIPANRRPNCSRRSAWCAGSWTGPRPWSVSPAARSRLPPT